jgi:hypothetical protein
VEPVVNEGYLTLERIWEGNDVIEVDWNYAVRLVKQDGAVVRQALTENPVKGALFYGPWLLGVNEELDPYFHGEPWRENVIWLPASIERPKAPVGPEGDPRIVEDAHLVVNYRHGGFPDPCTVTLRPVSEQTPYRQPMVTTWLNFQKPVE